MARKMDSKFPVHACILYCDAPTTPTVLRNMIRGTQYIFLMQFLTIINRPQTLYTVRDSAPTNYQNYTHKQIIN